ncbi:MAG: hypothetical protein KJ939_06220 [Nanoarchaeota archaeon]|nr:hypothetical protein [Nanoarchaeota archaeon]MBU4352644.1 hypothetical protein [Nanoarchaeota archaeon]
MKDAVVFTHPRSKPAVAYKKLAAALIGQDYVEDYSVKVEKKGFFVSLFRKVFK